LFLADSEVNAALDARASGGPNRQAGLSLTEPVLAAGVLTNITEPAAADYARVAYPASEWAAASDRSVTGDPVVFADPVSDWGVVGWAFLTDGAGTPTIPQKFAHPVDIKAGGSDISFTPAITDMTNLLDD
jgi:hypothetical protein